MLSYNEVVTLYISSCDLQQLHDIQTCDPFKNWSSLDL